MECGIGHAACFYQRTRDPAKPHRPTGEICANRGDLWEILYADGAKNWRVICFSTDRRSTQKRNTIGVCILRTRDSA